MTKNNLKGMLNLSVQPWLEVVFLGTVLLEDGLRKLHCLNRTFF